jgi:CDP-glucose 4,6-dehydratase
MANVVSRASFWHGRRVLITGHTGFKGAWLAAWLVAMGARVSGLALAPATDPNLHDLLGLGEQVDATIGDVRDRDLVEEVFARTRPEAVFHLAAQPLVRASYEDPLGTISTNVMGTANLLDVARSSDAGAIVVVTSDKCYENSEMGHPFHEGDQLGGRDPYSASKAAAEIITAAYRRSFYERDAIVATVRAGNVIGGGDWSPDRIVTDVVASARERRPLVLRFPQAYRPWQHVTDALCGYLTVAQRALAGDRSVGRAWNFAPVSSGALTVEAFARALLSELGSEIPIVVDGARAPHEAGTLLLDASDAVSKLGWRPRFDEAAAIAATGAWFRRFAAGESAAALTREQLPEQVSL